MIEARSISRSWTARFALPAHGKRSIDDLIRIIAERNRSGSPTDEAYLGRDAAA